MARTYQTARKSTGGRFVSRAPAEPTPAPVPAPVPNLVQPVEDVEEGLVMVYYFAEAEDGNIMEVDSPAPLPAALVPEAQAPAAAGGDHPDDSWDGSDGDDSDEEEDNDG